MAMEMIDVVEGGSIGYAAFRCLLVVDTTAEDVDELALEAGDKLAVT